MKLILLLIIPMVCFSQKEEYAKLRKLPKVAFEKAINDSIITLEATELEIFLKTLKNDYKTDLKPFNNSLINKFESCKWPMEMHYLLKMLLELKMDKPLIENTLNTRKEVWDKGQWAEKFWVIIRENKLKIKEELYYSVDDKGQKTYNIKSYLEEKVVNNELGINPILSLNDKLTDYTENKLLETLLKLNIKDATIISMDKSADLFGNRGIDGMIKILTR